MEAGPPNTILQVGKVEEGTKEAERAAVIHQEEAAQDLITILMVPTNKLITIITNNTIREDLIDIRKHLPVTMPVEVACLPNKVLRISSLPNTSVIQIRRIKFI